MNSVSDQRKHVSKHVWTHRPKIHFGVQPVTLTTSVSQKDTWFCRVFFIVWKRGLPSFTVPLMRHWLRHIKS